MLSVSVPQSVESGNGLLSGIGGQVALGFAGSELFLSCDCSSPSEDDQV